jgi:putative ABC transport system permease protein
MYTGDIFALPPTGQDVIENASQTISQIEKIPHVQAASAETILPGSLQYQNHKGSWQILAINPDAEKEVTGVSATMTAGSYLVPTDTDQIILGKEIAGGPNSANDTFSLQGVHVGDQVIFGYGQTKKTFTVKGVFDAKFTNTNQRAFITQAAYAQINPTGANQATSIVVKLDTRSAQDQVLSELRAANIPATFASWQDAAGMINTVTDSFQSINVILSTVSVLIAAIAIFIVIYIEVVSKRKQIGILRAIGIRPYLIRTTYVLQTVIYSLCGALLGTGLFYAILIPYFKAHPFVLPIADVTLYAQPVDFTIRFQTIIIVAIVSGLIPAFFITRQKIVDAISGK